MNKTDKYIIKAKLVHNNFYSYEFCEYVSCDIKLKISCPLHGVFEQDSYSHLQGRGCPCCWKERRKYSKRIDTSEFVSRAKIVHGNLYNYSKVNYTTSLSKVIIICGVHGEYQQIPSNHIAGRGCDKCARVKQALLQTSDTEEFITKATKIHASKYSYEKVEYLNNREDVIITCKDHGNFSQKPSDHLSGKGCKECGKYGYRRNIEGNFYILSNDDIIKVGITNNHPSKRLSQINRSSGKNFRLVCFFNFNDGSMPFNIEKSVLNYLRSNYKPVNEIFDGSTECFLDVNLTELINYVTPLAS